MTLILTTHDMHEAATLADRVGIMDHGKLLALDTPGGADALAARERDARARDTGARTDSRREQLVGALEQLPGVERGRAAARTTTDGGRGAAGPPLRRPARRRSSSAPAATLLAERGLALSGVELGEPTLEDVFIHLTGRSLR